MKKRICIKAILGVFLLVIILVAYIYYIPNIKTIPLKPGDSLRIISYNLKYASWNLDEWYPRRDEIVKQIEDYQPDILGVQEANEAWMSEEIGLPKFLDNYSFVGVGRDDGQKAGEYAAIFYRNDKFEVIDSGNFWLSETPDYPSRGWDGANKRICTWATFKDRETKKTFTHLNTHLDHEGNIARSEGVKLMINQVNQLVSPYILTGDFNFLEGSQEYQMIKDSGLFLVSKFATEDRVIHGSMNWFLPINVQLIPPIDFCFVSKKGIEVKSYRVDNSYRLDSIPLSDHFPIIVDVRIMH